MSFVDDGRITDPAVIAAVLAYCAARRWPCWAVHTRPESTIGGLSCELLAIVGERVVIRWANGDEDSRPLAEIHLSAI